MSEFLWRFQNYINKQEELHREEFLVERDVRQAEHDFALKASFRNDDPRYMFGIKGALRTDSLCSEYCYFDSCEQITPQKLDEYFALADTLRDEVTEYMNAGHQYTMVGMVICTDRGAAEVKKKLRRYSAVKRYRAPGNGWSEIRVCVVDLPSGEVYANSDGEALKRRLTEGVQPKQKGFFSKLFGGE